MTVEVDGPRADVAQRRKHTHQPGVQVRIPSPQELWLEVEHESTSVDSCWFAALHLSAGQPLATLLTVGAQQPALNCQQPCLRSRASAPASVSLSCCLVWDHDVASAAAALPRVAFLRFLQQQTWHPRHFSQRLRALLWLRPFSAYPRLPASLPLVLEQCLPPREQELMGRLHTPTSSDAITEPTTSQNTAHVHVSGACSASDRNTTDGMNGQHHGACMQQYTTRVSSMCVQEGDVSGHCGTHQAASTDQTCAAMNCAAGKGTSGTQVPFAAR